MSIKTNSETIRDETQAGANTASRVGSNLVEIADRLEGISRSNNLITTQIIGGRWATNGTFGSTQLDRSDLFPCFPNTTYIFLNLNNTAGLSFFGVTFPTETTTGGNEITLAEMTDLGDNNYSFVTPADANFMGIHWFKADTGVIELGLGDTVEEASLDRVKDTAISLEANARAMYANLSDNVRFEVVAAVLRAFAVVPFESGSVEPSVGNTLVGATSGESYEIAEVNLVSGDWSTNDAVGTFVLNSLGQYNTNRYTIGENLQVSGVTQAVRSAVAETMKYLQIGSGHKSVNVQSVVTVGNEIQLNFKKTYTNVISFIAAPDEDYIRNGWATGSSVGFGLARIRIAQQNANLTSGKVTGTLIDATDLANEDAGNIWCLGIFEV